MKKLGFYVSPTGRVVELRKPPCRKSEYYVDYKDEHAFFFDDFKMTAPFDLVLDVNRGSERVIFIDKVDADLILTGYDYLGVVGE
jgi:hypothetical protein